MYRCASAEISHAYHNIGLEKVKTLASPDGVSRGWHLVSRVTC